MTAEEVLVKLKAERDMFIAVGERLNGGHLTTDARIKLTGYEQAIIDVEEAIRDTVAAPRADQEGC